MKFVYGALLLIASITPTTFIGLKLYKYAPNKYIAAFSTTDGIKIANAASVLSRRAPLNAEYIRLFQAPGQLRG